MRSRFFFLFFLRRLGAAETHPLADIPHQCRTCHTSLNCCQGLRKDHQESMEGNRSPATSPLKERREKTVNQQERPADYDKVAHPVGDGSDLRAMLQNQRLLRLGEKTSSRGESPWSKADRQYDGVQQLQTTVMRPSAPIRPYRQLRRKDPTIATHARAWWGRFAAKKRQEKKKDNRKETKESSHQPESNKASEAATRLANAAAPNQPTAAGRGMVR